MDNFSQDSLWWQALTLKERLHLLRDHQNGKCLERIPQTVLKLVEEWRSQSPFHIKDWFAKRLELLEVNEQEFTELLGQPTSTLQELSSVLPQWLAYLIKAFSSTQAVPNHSQPADLYFTPLFTPLVEHAINASERKIFGFPALFANIPFEIKQAGAFLSSGLARHLDWMVSRTAVLELKIASLEGRLEGTTPEERFQAFVRSLAQPGAALEFLRGYPVLARLLAETVPLWIDSRVEFLERLCSDWELLSATFHIETTDMVERLAGELGDRHSGGRSVLLAHLKSGRKLIYKPRSLSVDEQFASLLSWLNSRGAPELRIPNVLNKNNYGWAEFVTAEPCRSREELARFYIRQGALLALLHTLEANDFHRENLIAHGEYPILIDLESLCRADFGLGAIETYRSGAAFELTTSVLQVGLLPQPRKGKDGKTIDFSGMGGREGQRWHIETPAWKNAGTDMMELIRHRQEIAAASNQPTLNGELVDPLEHSEQILDGFESMYRLLLQYRNELLAEGGPIDHFAEVEVRAIFRVTQFYALILNDSLHPDVLRDGLERDRLFDRIWFALDRNPLAHTALSIIPSEQSELWRGDIPCFRNRTDSIDVYSGQGTLIRGVFTRSGMSAVRSRFASLCEEDLARQKWLIQGSLTAFEMEVEGGMPHYVNKQDVCTISKNKLRLEAINIGDRLIQTAIYKDDHASWIGLSIIGNRWVLCPLSLDLYSGLPGIALFLAYLGKLEKREIYSTYAKKTLASIRKQLERAHSRPQQIGGFEGWGGLIYVWTQLAVLWDDEFLLEEAGRWLEPIIPLIDSDKFFDVIGGSAGGILALLKFWRSTGSESALNLAIRMGERLLDQARPASAGMGWTVPSDPEGPLTGFSHGASGIAFSLFRLKQATGDNRFQEMALQSLAFEASVFSAQAKNWLDLRGNRNPTSQRQKFMTAWCHGASGIGLCRLRMLHDLKEPQILQDLATAIQTTLTEGFGSNHSLCHGDLGNLELLLEASQTLGDPSYLQDLERQTAQTVASFEESGWLCGVPKGVETPGLMNGLAGIGYGLLRLAAPDQVPSVLLLD